MSSTNSPSPNRSTLTAEQLEDLQSFLKDWLRHTGRTQADLRRALRAASIRMPVLLEELNRTYSRSGLDGLVQQLCGIEDLWYGEDGWAPSGDAASRPALASPEADLGTPSLEASLGQLDLLLQEIREDHNP
ncbi:hypothetical protein KBY58_05005 [Cyanobium sp. HWJ4-Hawea]|uniref:hypothetical protein n=1 Tax=Cyanobium sp. HWJ4-Hawea TaxID=2823713 RepID=UPI0020CEE3B3|nr:hypothetical protein [Cyanobium sp. HWJ4-Hawea]MCP9808787.1 hypothetical protein [Cyanobium sp. HWJ4-Hawea]